MAVETVDFVGERVLGRLPRTRTRELTLDGAGAAPADASAHLRGRHGANAATVLELAREIDLDRPLFEGLPYLEAEVVYAARYELAATVDDVLERRTRASGETRHARAVAGRVEELLRL